MPGCQLSSPPIQKALFQFHTKPLISPFQKFQRHKTSRGREHCKCSFYQHPEPKSTKHSVSASCVLLASGTHTHKTRTQPATAQTSPTSAPTKSPELFNSELEPGSSPAERQAALGKYRENVLSNKTLQTGLKRNTWERFSFFPRNCFLTGFRKNN